MENSNTEIVNGIEVDVEKAQKLIGLDIPKERDAKNKFNETVLPEWRKQADQREKSYSNQIIISFEVKIDKGAMFTLSIFFI